MNQTHQDLSADPVDANHPELNGAHSEDAATANNARAQTATEPELALSAQSLSDELAAAQTRAEQMYEQFIRAQAEMDNIRRRAKEDVAKAHKFGIESFAQDLIPVKDSLEMALAGTSPDPAKLREGVELTLRQLKSAFEKNALKEIAPAAGDKFDPRLHQGISMVPSELPAQTVVMTLQKGAMIAERVLRPALVSVSSGPATA
jgi:molecular chaperone GrpE